jgi:hypothetical protein
MVTPFSSAAPVFAPPWPETAKSMIMARNRRYLPVSGHDHENSPHAGKVPLDGGREGLAERADEMREAGRSNADARPSRVVLITARAHRGDPKPRNTS